MVYRVTNNLACDDGCCLVGVDPYYNGVFERQIRNNLDRVRGHPRPMFEVLFLPQAAWGDTYRWIPEREHEIDKRDRDVTQDFVRKLRQEIREEEEYQCQMAA